MRTKTIVKNAIVEVDATPFRTWFETHYHAKVGAKEEVIPEGADKKVVARIKAAKGRVEPKLEEQFAKGRLLACIASRPGQSGRADGYILEGKELEFYQRKIAQKKTK